MRYFVVFGKDGSNLTRVAAIEAVDEDAAITKFVSVSEQEMGAAAIAEITKQQYDAFIDKMLADHGLPNASSRFPTKQDKLN